MVLGKLQQTLPLNGSCLIAIHVPIKEHADPPVKSRNVVLHR